MKPTHQSTTLSPESIDLSIVIVSWNTREVLRECLESVFHGLAELKAEVFVVDNASSDGSAEMVQADFPEAKLITNSQNLGFAKANNQAIRKSHGRHILLLNSDTVVLRDVLPRSVNYMDMTPFVGVMGCRVLNSDGSVQLTCSRYPTLLNLLLLTTGLYRCSGSRFLSRYQMREWKRDTEREVDTVTGCYMLVRRTAIEQVGLLDEAFFFYGEETDWCRRFQDARWSLRMAPVGEIVHHGSLSSRKCNHRRDVMLTRGLMQYHRKHSSGLATFCAWVLLAVFCVLRSIYWGLLSLFVRSEYSRKRFAHFIGVLRDFRQTWPKKEAVS